MRLKTIKLAGFKSFVDLTQVHFSSNLTAVVGPNGCGKSNVIDAVRWVMGESSAKTLRGSAMTDVIFNGSTQRQPVGKASIELVFDNSDHSLQGEYGRFAEISVRREVTRDAQSNYYLNGTRCRRRDITDLFLGTGLGPRSYAIIEQGMISRFIEAKPDELRTYVEEAAGVSRYKERRKETESRLKRTRENLERLADLEDELSRQLAHLKRQAEAAKRFKTLGDDIRLASARLAARRWADLESQANLKLTLIEGLTADIEQSELARSTLASQIDALRQQNDDAQVALEAAQADFYGAGADVSRQEQRLASFREQRRTLEQSHSRLIARLQTAEQQLGQDRQQEQHWSSQHQSAVATIKSLDAQVNPLETALRAAESNWRSARNEQQSHQQQRFQLEQTLRTAQQQTVQAQRQIEQLTSRRQRLLAQRPEMPEDERSHIQAQIQSLSDLLGQGQFALDDLRVGLGEDRERREQWLEQRQALDVRASALQAKHSTLTELLNSQGSDADGPTLADSMQIDSDKAQALASALGPLSRAQRVESLDALSLEQCASDNWIAGSLPSDWFATDFAGLSRVRWVQSLEQALQMRPQLQAHELCITPEGQQVGQHWVLGRPEVDNRPLLRAQLAELDQTQADLQAQLQALEDIKPLDRTRDLEAQILAAETDQKTIQRQVDQLNAQAEVVKQRLADYDLSHQRFESDLLSIDQELEDAFADQEDANESLEAARDRLDTLPPAPDISSLESEWHAARDDLDELQSSLSQANLNAQTSQARLEALSSNLERARMEIEDAQDGLADVQEQLDQLTEPADIQSELDSALRKRLQAEQQLGLVRESMRQQDQQVREYDHKRTQFESELAIARQKVADVRAELSEKRALQIAQHDQLIFDGFKPEAVVAELGDETESALKVALEKLEAQRNRLGAVNLAAMEELQQAQERQDYYAQQRTDLESALETLDLAIRKIDRETRTLFKATFDRLNAGLQALFPKVFGGGEAWLELTDDDPLESGISLMARPPGKKNSTIHLLSGGEKALTAVALVFAIFQLNPAPFCMLDEVDAPLDDANVGRYANLLHEMADQVQFIFITHNKIAMEKAEHLMGVTMHEPGVSRLVSVDVAQAVAMTQ